jgi:hypothetical protein
MRRIKFRLLLLLVCSNRLLKTYCHRSSDQVENEVVVPTKDLLPWLLVSTAAAAAAAVSVASCPPLATCTEESASGQNQPTTN